MSRHTLLTAACVAMGAVTPAPAALILEYIHVPSMAAGPSNGPALTQLSIAPGQTVFLQIAMRDTLGAGPNFNQLGTLPWQTFGGQGGPGSLGIGAFIVRFDGIPGVVENPAPTTSTNARLVPANYFYTTAGTNPPTSTSVGGLLQGNALGAVPDPVTRRIPLFNLRLNALAPGGGGVLRLGDPHPVSNFVDNAVVHDADISGTPNTGFFTAIDDLLFGPTFTNTFDLVVVPEPSGLAHVGLAAALWRCRKRCRPTT